MPNRPRRRSRPFHTRPLLPRTYNFFSQMAGENAQSRVYLGIHWEFDAAEGIRSGDRIGDYVFTHTLTPLNGRRPVALPSLNPYVQIGLSVRLENVAANGGLGSSFRQDVAVCLPSLAGNPATSFKQFSQMVSAISTAQYAALGPTQTEGGEADPSFLRKVTSHSGGHDTTERLSKLFNDNVWADTGLDMVTLG